MKRPRIAAEKSVEFIRGYEVAVAQTIGRVLAESFRSKRGKRIGASI